MKRSELYIYQLINTKRLDRLFNSNLKDKRFGVTGNESFSNVGKFNEILRRISINYGNRCSNKQNPF